MNNKFLKRHVADMVADYMCMYMYGVWFDAWAENLETVIARTAPRLPPPRRKAIPACLEGAQPPWRAGV